MFKYFVLLVCLAHVSLQRGIQLNTAIELSDPVRDPRCPAQEEGALPIYLKHDTNCWQFYECSNGYLVELSCAPGTYFQADFGLNVCDVAGNVNCGDLQTTLAPAN